MNNTKRPFPCTTRTSMIATQRFASILLRRDRKICHYDVFLAATQHLRPVLLRRGFSEIKQYCEENEIEVVIFDDEHKANLQAFMYNVAHLRADNFATSST